MDKFYKPQISKTVWNLPVKYPDDDHGSIPLISEYDSLRFIFPFLLQAEIFAEDDRLLPALQKIANSIIKRFFFQKIWL